MFLGRNRIDELKSFLLKIPGKKRLVVDELRHTGMTGEIAMGILHTVDPGSSYGYFTLFESAELGGRVFTPWHGFKGAVDEGDPKSFFAIPQPIELERRLAHPVRDRLNALVDEIIKEREKGSK